MKTVFRLMDGRRVTVEQTMTRITAQYEGGEKRDISSTEYMNLIMAGTPTGDIEN